MRCESTKTAFFLTETEGSCNLEYMFSVHGSNRLGKRTAKSPREMVQLERTVSDGAFSTTVKRSWRFASLGIKQECKIHYYAYTTSTNICDIRKDRQLHIHASMSVHATKTHKLRESRGYVRSHQKCASIIINRHRASIADAWSSGYWNKAKAINVFKRNQMQAKMSGRCIESNMN